jgi:hypothetical protein
MVTKCRKFTADAESEMWIGDQFGVGGRRHANRGGCKYALVSGDKSRAGTSGTGEAAGGSHGAPSQSEQGPSAGLVPAAGSGSTVPMSSRASSVLRAAEHSSAGSTQVEPKSLESVSSRPASGWSGTLGLGSRLQVRPDFSPASIVSANSKCQPQSCQGQTDPCHSVPGHAGCVRNGPTLGTVGRSARAQPTVPWYHLRPIRHVQR